MIRNILAIIPARGGSKGLPRKNILNLQGKPLMAWSIESSLKSKYITKTIVSSDDDDILNVAKEYNASVLKRPEELATDISNSEVVALHVLEELKKKNEIYNYIILLQPTSPLRTEEDIDNAFEVLFDVNATALISVEEYDNKILKAFKENKNGFIEGISNNSYPFTRRQDLPKTYISNGAIYIVEVNEFIQHKSFFTNKTIKFDMDKIKSMDIDTEEDFNRVKQILGYRE